MSEHEEHDEDDAPEQSEEVAALSLSVVTDGTPEGTRLVDKGGKEVRFDGHVSIDMMGEPDHAGMARISIVFPEAKVKVAEECKAPFHHLGLAVGGKGGPAPLPGKVSGQTASAQSSQTAGTRQGGMGGGMLPQSMIAGNRKLSGM